MHKIQMWIICNYIFLVSIELISTYLRGNHGKLFMVSKFVCHRFICYALIYLAASILNEHKLPNAVS